MKFNKNPVSVRRSSGQEGGGFKGAPCTPACKYNSLLGYYQKELIVCATHHASTFDSQSYSLLYNIIHFDQPSESLSLHQNWSLAHTRWRPDEVHPDETQTNVMENVRRDDPGCRQDRGSGALSSPATLTTDPPPSQQ